MSNRNSIILTAWKVSKYGVFPGPYFPAFELNTERYFVFHRIQSEYGKIRTRKNSVFGHFSRSVWIVKFNMLQWFLIIIQSIQGKYSCFRSSLIYNTSTRHEQHECDTSDTSATRMKNFDFDNDTIKKHIFTPLYLLYGKWKITRRGTISF